jgi:hypothetical protein
MAWTATANNNTAENRQYALPPEGTSAAVCVACVDLGTHPMEFTDQQTGDRTTRDYRRGFVVWELTDEEDPGKGDMNFLLGKEYTIALGVNSKLRPVVETALGRKLGVDEQVPDIAAVVLGMRCQVQVEHGVSKGSGKPFASIKAVVSASKKNPPPDPKCGPYRYDLDDGPFVPPAWLPGWSFGKPLAEIMAASKERQAQMRGAAQTAARTAQSRRDPVTDGVVAAMDRMAQPTPAPAQAPAGAKWWTYPVPIGGGGPDEEPVLMDLASLCHHAHTHQLTAETLEVCPENGEGKDWKTAADYKLDLTIPF